MKILFLLVSCLLLQSNAHQLASGISEKNLVDDAVAAFLRAIISKLPEGFPSLGIPPLDPIQISHIDLNIHEDSLTMVGTADDIAISGLSLLDIKDVHVNVLTTRVSFNVSLADLLTEGSYSVDGLLISLFPVYGHGPFTLNVSDIYIVGSIQIGTDDNGFIYLKDLDFDLNLGGLVINFEGLYGGESLSQTINSIMSSVIYEIYLKYKDQLLTAGTAFVQNFVNNHVLVNVTMDDLLHLIGIGRSVQEPFLVPRLDAHVFFDELFADIRQRAAEEGLDPITFPADSDVFNVTLFNATMEGSVKVSNSRIGGLSTIHRTGDCTLTIQDRVFDMIVSMGANDVLFGVDVQLGVGIIGVNLDVTLVVSHVSLTVDAILDLATFNSTLRDFVLNEIGAVDFTIKGIPMGSKDLSNLLDLVSNGVKDSLLYAFQEALRPLIWDIIAGGGIYEFIDVQKLQSMTPLAV